MKRLPLGYTMSDGGVIQPWNNEWGMVETDTLQKLQKPTHVTRVEVYTHPMETSIPDKVLVHSLFFSATEVWDCLNGWRPLGNSSKR